MILVVIGLAFCLVLSGTACALACAVFLQSGRVLVRLERLESRVRLVGTMAATADLAGNSPPRDGLAPGVTAAPFRLPRLDGGELSLDAYLGRRVLLVFSDADCIPCLKLAPRLEELHREHPDPAVIMVSRGDPDVNRKIVARFGLSFPVGLQHGWHVSRDYRVLAAPAAYLIDERGLIASPAAIGVDDILTLVTRASEEKEALAAGA